MATHSLEEEVLGCLIPHQQQEKRLRPQPEQALRCPRCDSTNTKFCYYNNYSLSQPRYFCKGCRRYWTKGGSLRNVPVGGGCRKNKRSSSSSSTSSSSSSRKTQQDAINPNPLLSTLPPAPGTFAYDPNDLTLAFARLQKPPIFAQLGLDDVHDFMTGNPSPNHITSSSSSAPGFLDILRGGFLDNGSSPSSFHFQNLCYGFGGNQNGGEEVVPPLEEMGGGATALGKQESFKSMEEDDNKVMVGLQWQLGGDGKNMVVDSGRDYWSNGVGSSWHGLVNSSLM